MNHRDRYIHENDWKKRILIMEMYHLMAKLVNPDWHIYQTASYFSVSPSLVTENLRIATLIKNDNGEIRSRNHALKLIKESK